MPALPPVPKACRVVLNGLISGSKPWVNAFHTGYSVGASITATEILQIATDVASAWATNVAPSLSDTIELVSVVATALDSASAPEATVPSGAFGHDTSQSVAGGTAAVMQRKIARRYRGGHSRVYIPGCPASWLDDTEEAWDPTNIAALATQWESCEGVVETYLIGQGHTDALSVNISYYEGFTNVLYPSGRYHARPTLRVTPLVDKVTGIVPNPRPCSQRRRQQP